LTDAAPGLARHWFADLASEDLDLQDRIVLLLSELVSNSVAHSGLRAPDEVSISISPIAGGLHVEVVDEGVGIEDLPAEGSDSFGLRLVERTSDRWGYSNDPTTVWFEITGGSG
jgi:anti-sigma regulatory factor (Ser/Thr protein kinase)